MLPSQTDFSLNSQEGQRFLRGWGASCLARKSLLSRQIQAAAVAGLGMEMLEGRSDRGMTERGLHQLNRSTAQQPLI